ncbi:MAG: transposase, partial [Thermoplasmata archaeon]|nr:transposase [Thermoplasmata archaeon]
METPELYVPTSVLALDTNERSLDGVLARPGGSTPVTVPYPEIPQIQHRHFVRRRRLGRKKATDRRVGRRLGGREGRRERARVSSRLHRLSKGLVGTAEAEGAALVLEDLHLPRVRPGSRRMCRRLSSWPQRELHRQLQYKAEEQGVPVLMVNPAYTSKTCPRCGVRKDRRSRVGRVFVCDHCRWR